MNLRLLPLLLLASGLAAPAVRADLAADVDTLIPKIAAANFEERYAPQMELMAMTSKAGRPGAESERAALAKLLGERAANAATPQAARVWLTRQLEWIGKAESVPVLARLLTEADVELRETARRALQANPEDDATTALRDALKTGSSDATWRAGLAAALAERGDIKAVPAIAALLGEASTRSVIADALGKIGTADALAALLKAYDGKSVPVGKSVIAAARKLAASDRDAAKKIFVQLAGEANPEAIRAAATTSLVRLDPALAARLVPASLTSGLPALQAAAVNIVNASRDAKLVKAVADLMPKLDAGGKIVALSALDGSAEDAIVAAANDADEAVRTIAYETMGRAGGAASVPVLLAAAASKQTSRQAAAKALVQIRGPGAADALVKAAAAGDAGQRAAAIAALAGRRESEQLPAILKFATDADKGVQKAAFEAIRAIGTDKEIQPLIDLVASTGSDEGAQALKTLVLRSPDRAKAAKAVAATASTAATPGKLALLSALAAAGGPDALAFVEGLTASTDKAVQDGSIRALSQWTDTAATPVLLKKAADAATSESHNVLLLRGLAKLIGDTNSTVAAAERADAGLAAMQAARRDEERKLIMAALANVPHAKSVTAIKELLAKPGFEKEAAFAAADLATAMVKVDKKAAKELAALVKDKVDGDARKKVDEVLKK